MTPDDVVGELQSGMTLGIGGWGSRRKPMTLVRALARSSVTDLTVVTYGGPDAGILCALGKVRKLVYGFVSLDSIPLEPWFRRVRQEGRLPEVMELDEGMLQLGLRAAAWRLPFLPTRVGPGSAVMSTNPGLRTVRSPYDDATELVAMPALRLDAAFVHVHRADLHGNGQVLGPDPYFDDLFCLAADRAYMSCEAIGLDTDRLYQAIINPTMVAGVVHAPGGAWFTECPPDYDRDEALQAAYAATARDDDAWQAFVAEHLS
ncbi:MAG: CoA transferase subunit A [Alphaproteobacteria bacterium]|nr:CoA transferase subunit A [Alphaproteobacteria bacterium]